MKKNRLNGRSAALALTIGGILLLCLLTLVGTMLTGQAVLTDFSQKNMSPCYAHPFGTDWLGRDMLARTLAGLALSIKIGCLTALTSAVIALALGMGAAMLGEKADGVISWCIDLVMGIPHILLVMLISLACGKGMKGVVVGVAFSHWPSLARVIRGEILQQKQAPYVMTAKKLGSSPVKIALRHFLPFLAPQFLTGLILQFPHAILHEASITFLGFGLSSQEPAIGVILSESMRYLSTGKWWLALFPGLALAAVTVLFAVMGERLKNLVSPSYVHR